MPEEQQKGQLMKHKISRIQCDLLRMLEEAGEENLSCFKKTLSIQDEAAFAIQVDGLRRLGFVQDSRETGARLPALMLTETGRRFLRK